MKWLICLFKDHDWQEFKKKMVIGTLFGQKVEATNYQCNRCGKNDGRFICTETLTL